MTDPGVSRDELNSVVDGLRREVNTAVTTAGVQIGAVEKVVTERIVGVEKTLVEKIQGVKVWGALALVGGQAVAALLTKLMGGSLVQPAQSAMHFLNSL